MLWQVAFVGTGEGNKTREWDDSEYHEFCMKHGRDAPSAEHGSFQQEFTRAQLESMCGTEKLLEEIQNRQCAHILSKRFEIVGKLRRHVAQMDTKVYH